MAGNYPDPTTWRMALDRDGSVMTMMNEAGVIMQLSAAQLAKANDEWQGQDMQLGPNGSMVHHIAVIFPEKRDIDAWYISTGGSYTSALEVSTNSTNGQDGTWVSAGNFVGHNYSDNWRTAIQTGTVLAVKAIRFRFGGNTQWVYLGALHLWGEIAPSENPDRLSVWDPAADTHISPATLDWGDTPRSSSADRTFRIKNLSPTKQANNIRVSFDILTDATSGSPSVPAQYVLSYNGSPFVAQVNIGGLGPGTISGPITVRRITPSNAQLGLFAPRVAAVADTWT